MRVETPLQRWVRCKTGGAGKTKQNPLWLAEAGKTGWTGKTGGAGKTDGAAKRREKRSVSI